jgi:hypothetical protein
MTKQLSHAFAFALLATLSSTANAVELTSNGGFETGTFAGWTQFPSGPNQFITNVNPASGVFASEINNTILASNSLIKQANLGIGIVTPGQLITISFSARGSFADGGVAFAEFFSEKSGGGTSKSEILGGGPLTLHPTNWTNFNFTTTAGTDVSGGVTLQLGAATGAASTSMSHVFYDNASVTVVPEPATYAVLGIGALALIRRRKNRS